MTEKTTKIRVVGVGGCGTNVVISMINNGLRDVDFYLVNTDQQHLNNAREKDIPSEVKKELGDTLHFVKIGEGVTKGQGAGADPSVGEKAAEESRAEIASMIAETDLLFLIAGMGGGTGTGAAPVIAKIAKDVNPDILIISEVTTPMNFEFARKTVAEKGIEKLQKCVDSLIVIPNQKVVCNSAANTTVDKAFKEVDTIISNAVIGVSDIINYPGKMNVDFADIKRIMKGKGYSHIGLGEGKGKPQPESDRMLKAIRAAASTEILNSDMVGATGMIINLQADEDDLNVGELNEIDTFISEMASKNVECIFGYQTDPKYKGTVKITIIAAGFKPDNASMNKRPVYNTMQQYPQVYQRGGTFQQPQRPVQPQQAAPIQVPQRPPVAQLQQPPTARIDSTRGNGADSEAPSFMRRSFGRKKENK